MEEESSTNLNLGNVRESVLDGRSSFAGPDREASYTVVKAPKDVDVEGGARWETSRGKPPLICQVKKMKND